MPFNPPSPLLSPFQKQMKKAQFSLPQSFPPLPILPPTPQHLPLHPHHQPTLLLLLPLNRPLQIRIIPRQTPQRPIDHLPQAFDLRVIARSDVALCEPGSLARAGAAAEGERCGGRVGGAVWEVWVGAVVGCGDGGVGAGEGCCCWHCCWCWTGFGMLLLLWLFVLFSSPFLISVSASKCVLRSLVMGSRTSGGIFAHIEGGVYILRHNGSGTGSVMVRRCVMLIGVKRREAYV